MPESDQYPGSGLVYRIDEISTSMTNRQCFAESAKSLKSASRTFKGILDLFLIQHLWPSAIISSQLFFEKVKLQAATVRFGFKNE